MRHGGDPELDAVAAIACGADLVDKVFVGDELA
jgi:hypothetical protein